VEEGIQSNTPAQRTGLQTPGSRGRDERCTNLKSGTTNGGRSVYFRHGAKSEPGTSDDLRDVIEKRLAIIRQEWLRGIKQVTEAPPGSMVVIHPAGITNNNGQPISIRVVDNPDAAAFGWIGTNKTHPYRGIEVLDELKARKPELVFINRFDIHAVCQAYDVEEQEHYCYRPLHASNRYSESFINWILSEYEKNEMFFSETRERIKSK
jgi:hypothetical protein